MTTTMQMIEAYPLTWPDGWPRKQSHQRNSSTYRVAFAVARDNLVRELRLAGARDVIVSSNVPLRRDGLPLAGMAEPRDPGVAVYWTDRQRRPRVMAFDGWRTTRENLRAIGRAVEHLRGLERIGATMQERAFSGFALLPTASDDDDPWRRLGLERGSTTRDQLVRRYRELVHRCHPDRGGDATEMALLNAAYERASREVA